MDDQQDEKKFFLKNVDIYDNIPEESLSKIAEHTFEEDYRKNTPLYSPHKPDGFIYVLKRGEVILYHSKDGKRSIFDTLEPGAVFGSFDPDNLTPNHFAQTTKNSYLYRTPVGEFLKIITAHPKAVIRLMQKMTARINDYEQKIQNSIETAAERVYQELLRLNKKRQHSLLGKWMQIPLQVTHEEIAERTNLNRVTVTRCLKKLRLKGLITIEKETGIIHLEEACKAKHNS